jgi:hypothetical protein
MQSDNLHLHKHQDDEVLTSSAKIPMFTLAIFLTVGGLGACAHDREYRSTPATADYPQTVSRQERGTYHTTISFDDKSAILTQSEQDELGSVIQAIKDRTPVAERRSQANHV